MSHMMRRAATRRGLIDPYSEGDWSYREIEYAGSYLWWFRGRILIPFYAAFRPLVLGSGR